MSNRTVGALGAAVLVFAGATGTAQAGTASWAGVPAAAANCARTQSTYSTPQGPVSFASPQDIDDDGFTDLVEGVPAAAAGAGVVDVHYDYDQSDPDISARPHAQRVGESFFTGVAQTTHDNFGASIAFVRGNADNCADLAVGAPGADGGRGKVVIALGSPTGLASSGAVIIAGAAAGDRFGSAVVAVDNQLWISAPGRSLGATHAGAVYHYEIEGGRAVLVETLREGAAPVGGRARANDGFGQTLAFDDGKLVIGAPAADVGKATDAGAVTVVRTDYDPDAPRDDRALSATTVTQNSPGIGGVAQSNDHFGTSVAVVDGDVVVVGVPGESLGRRKDAGLVQVLRDAAGKVTDLADLTQDSKGVPGKAEAGDRFGASVYAGGVSINGGFSGALNIAVGVPGEDLGKIRDAGMVNTFELDGSGAHRRVKPLSTIFCRCAGGHVGGAAHAGDEFGAGLSAADYSDEQDPDVETGGANLVMAVPGSNDGAGALALATIGDPGKYNLHDTAGYRAGERYGVGANTLGNGAYTALD